MIFRTVIFLILLTFIPAPPLVAQSIVISGNNYHTFLKSYLALPDGNVLFGEFSSDTLFMNRQFLLVNKGRKASSLKPQQDGFFLRLNDSGQVVSQYQFWSNGRKDDSLYINNSGDVTVFKIIQTKDQGFLLTGYFAGDTLHIGNAELYQLGDKSLFIYKINSQGKTEWYKVFNLADSYTNGTIKGLVEDKHGNIIIAGEYGGTIHFDGDSLECFTCSVHDVNIFFAKYSADGQYLWSKRIGGNDFDYLGEICITAQDDIVITGWYLSNTLPFGKDTIENEEAGKGTANAYLGVVDSNGLEKWIIQSTSIGDETAVALTVDSAAIYLLGNFNGSKLAIGDTSITNSGAWSFYIAKHSLSGKLEWVQTPYGTYAQFGKDIVYSGGNLLVVGDFESDSLSLGDYRIYNQGGKDIFITQINPQGKFNYAEGFGSLDNEYPVLIIDNAFLSKKVILGQFNSSNLSIQNNYFTNTHKGFKYYNGFIGRIDFPTTINVNSVKNVVQVFPNPFSTSFQITMPDTEVTDYEVILMNAYGQQIYTWEDHASFLEIKLGYSLPVGLYLLQIRTGGKVLYNDILIKI